MLQPTKGQRVWVAILPPRNQNEPARRAGTIEPTALVPGIVFDPTPMNRTVIRRGGNVVVQNAVDVITFHSLDDGRQFYKHQGQGLIGLHPRDKYIKAIDGPKDEPMTNQWAQTLYGLAAESLAGLATEPEPSLIAEAEKRYSNLPAPVAAAN